MHETFFTLAIVWMVGLLGALVLLASRQRSSADMLMSVDTLGLVICAVLALYGATRGEAGYLDAALVLALLSYVQTVAGARFLHHGRTFHDEEDGR
ncbi:multiple resistance and pH regulation protein F [Corallococcus exiguus]|uniref:monovalent cation/H+ antiporter complex subunit F n=1 Tax=Corallococcus TaxID=83461 RepID=UPI000ED9F415|nr:MULTISPECIES: monovalent cation/H+ antiporter complex subunit F [Corallococcus]NNB87148.1 multiple resistance and pH regulation protein F [Corallococcus exiguus]NNB95078.1 multiple resistance and pH regulation protein F [Corallococcus exiguus]NNC04515.1 multiple resistance and pH regulation protein F [Corallococcus exiguus]NPC49994.1 multiple resistance and pH regulation protein F [Corallococcus exiguus]RKH78412.1 multiple resistance and pH regulation protein F [Corallococcus sp. AB032C]